MSDESKITINVIELKRECVKCGELATDMVLVTAPGQEPRAAFACSEHALEMARAIADSAMRHAANSK